MACLNKSAAGLIAALCPRRRQKVSVFDHRFLYSNGVFEGVRFYGYLRIIVTRGVRVLGINPNTCKQPNIIIIADQLQMVSDVQRAQGVRAIIASTYRLTPDRRDSRIKSLNYLNAILARLEANHADVKEAILLNDRGCVAEGTTDNLFIVSDGALLTLPATEGVLAHHPQNRTEIGSSKRYSSAGNGNDTL
jgi:branched-chain amino acid aminotransferase